MEGRPVLQKVLVFYCHLFRWRDPTNTEFHEHILPRDLVKYLYNIYHPCDPVAYRYSLCHESGSFGEHSCNVHYLSIPKYTFHRGNRFHEACVLIELSKAFETYNHCKELCYLLLTREKHVQHIRYFRLN